MIISCQRSGTNDKLLPKFARSHVHPRKKYFQIDSAIQKLIVLQVDKTPLIAVERDGDKLLFDAYVYNKDGIIAAKIDRGEFRLNPKATFYGEHANKNRSDLTVYDDHNQQLLRIYYANSNTVFITGIFYSEAGSQAIITDQAIFVTTTSSMFYGDYFKDFGLGVSRNALFQTKPILTGSKP